jgi:D-alanyl-D-alanine carboxypeptidase
MLKKILIIIGIILGVLFLIGFIFRRYFRPEAKTIVEFLKNNPERSSVYVVRNGKVTLDLRSDRKMPLASTVKIIVAIEFAEQAAAGKIDQNEAISLADLDRFYLTDTDGGAHPEWLKEMNEQKKISDNKISIMEVAKGMIKFSSNANTEYLMMRLGFDKLNARLDSLGIQNHDKLFPVASSLFVFSNDKKVENKQFLQEIKDLTPENYVKRCFEIHEKLKTATDTSFKNSLVFPDMDLQKIWSDRLMASTTKEYVGIVQKINSHRYFSEKTQAILDPIMEYIFDLAPLNRKIYTHLGMKGGSTAWILTEAMYATTQKGDQIEAAIFFNDLTEMEAMRLEMSLNAFRLACVSEEKSAEMVKELMRF